MLAAGRGAPEDSERALASLCESYWYPVYAHIRRRGRDPEQSRDLVQGFFHEFLAKRLYERADPDRGRFRSFLCKALEHYLQHEREHASALKRGGGCEIVSWDQAQAESRYEVERSRDGSPADAYQRAWAQALLDRVFSRLRMEFVAEGREAYFDRLRPHLWQEDDATPYAQLAQEFQLTTVNIKVSVHRLRRRFGSLLREEIRRTVDRDSEVEEELNHLIQALAPSR